ncbi:hypothetical protein PTTG_09042 [Puccinia triticina 1-1 BBBD Race 1]|uniref:Secreted protein n=2 Tax=Puccinia triticina TaxID=208348 RepID=A0A180GP55_PUCT1|nr:uncharacterized protein PtA15_4A711 [Puccinia triticina]OAV93743.1 hypothetical protein PTTG_09042 [Puccinia triticina 1-1 BBBD Race 1]WAQ84258.1 hypothetical protein PtA15_4A711 [Puccinia triticina]
MLSMRLAVVIVLLLGQVVHQSAAAPMYSEPVSTFERFPKKLNDAIALAYSRPFDPANLPKKKTAWSRMKNMVGLGRKPKNKDKQVEEEVTETREEVESSAASSPTPSHGSPAHEGGHDYSAEDPDLVQALRDRLNLNTNRGGEVAQGGSSYDGGQAAHDGYPSAGGYAGYGAGTHNAPAYNSPPRTYDQSTHYTPGYTPPYGHHQPILSYNIPPYRYNPSNNWDSSSSGGYQVTHPQYYANDQGYQNSWNNYKVVQSDPIHVDQDLVNALDVFGPDTRQYAEANRWEQYGNHPNPGYY